MNDEIVGRKLRVIPILKEPCDIPPFLKGKIWADLSKRDSYMNGVLRIAKQVRNILEERIIEERQRMEAETQRLVEDTSGITLECVLPAIGGRLSTSLHLSPRPRAIIDGEPYKMQWYKSKFLRLRPQEGHRVEVYVPVYGIIPIGRAITEVFLSAGQRKAYVYKAPLTTFGNGILRRVDEDA